MTITRNIREFARQSEGDRIKEQLALDPQPVAILNSYAAWYDAGNRNVDQFLQQQRMP